MFDNNLIDPKGLLIWGGGEPTINVEFDEITRLAMDHRMRMFVNTSGIVYSDVLADALRNGLATVQCSLDSGDADTYIAMKGRDRFEQIVENLTLYAEKNPDNIVLKYIINDKNNSDGSIVGFLNIAKRLGITRIALSPEAKEAWAGEISIATLGAINIFLHEAKKRRLSVDVFYSLFGEEYSKLIKETCEVQTPPPDWAIRYFNRLSPGLQKRIRKVYEILRDSSLTEPD
jgi:MoaA/NifB/PqqE/SkfB family radical SAM enzyme